MLIIILALTGPQTGILPARPDMKTVFWTYVQNRTGREQATNTLLDYVWYEVLTAVVMKSTIFRHLLPHWFLAWLILRPWRWRQCSSETSVDFQWTTRRYIPEDSTLHPAWLFGLLFNPEDVSSTFLQNVSKVLPRDMAPYTRRQYSSFTAHHEKPKSHK
jgi:hypothetical protein